MTPLISMTYMVPVVLVLDNLDTHTAIIICIVARVEFHVILSSIFMLDCLKIENETH